MTKQKAMEWAEKAHEAWEDATTNVAGFEAMATVLMEATEGLYRIGERVSVKSEGKWMNDALVVSARAPVGNILPENVRPLPTKRPKTKRELAKDIGWWAGGVSWETYQRMATDLGIDLEVEE